MISILITLLSCGPADLNTTGTHDTQANIAPAPTEFGVISASDCSQTQVGDYACNVVLYDQNKEPWQLYDNKDKVVVLDFSTSWCPPCQNAGMYVQDIQDDYGDDLVFATLLVEGYTQGLSPTEDEMLDWVVSHNITTAPVLYAGRDLVFDSTGVGTDGYVIGGFPTYIYIDRNGKIAGGHAGFSDSHVRELIDGLQ